MPGPVRFDHVRTDLDEIESPCEVVQILVLQCVMVPIAVGTAKAMPWSVGLANALDVVNMCFVCLLLTSFALYAVNQDPLLISRLCVALVVGLFTSLACVVAHSIHGRSMPG